MKKPSVRQLRPASGKPVGRRSRETMLDTSESGYAALCGEQTSGPCAVSVEEVS